MKINDIKKQLQKESKAFVPDIKDQIFASLNIEPKYEKRKPSFQRKFKPVFTFSLFLLIFSVGIFLFLDKPGPVVPINITYISIDINPSIELEVDEDNIVIDVRPLNLDAVLLLEESEELIGKNSNDAISTIINLASSLGYLNSNNEVLISAINDNQEKEDEININIKNYFKNHSNVRFQETTEELKSQAKNRNISVGKMILVQKVLDANPSITMDEAVQLHVKKLNEILRDYSEESIKEFRERYRKRIKGLAENKDNALKDYLNSINIDLENINKIKLNEQQEFIIELINVKYETQVRSFNNKIMNDIKEKEFEMNFEFDTDFSMSDVQGNNMYNRREKEALKLITQIEILMNLAHENNSLLDSITLEVEELMEDYNELISSDEISQDFRGNNISKDFQDRYQRFNGNI